MVGIVGLEMILKPNFQIKIFTSFRRKLGLFFSSSQHCCSFIQKENHEAISVFGKDYSCDHMTNLTPKILDLVGRKLHLQESHPLGLLRKRIVSFMYNHYLTPRGNPLFSVFDSLEPVVTPKQNFDSLLVPSNHVSRQKKDNYYINEKYLLRAHTTAHQTELISMGLDNFLIIGDVYRRDEIDSSHYPVFHQADAVRIFNKQDIFGHCQNLSSLSLFEEREETPLNQNCHPDVVVEKLAKDLQNCLVSLAVSLLGRDIQFRWVDAFFPFTHPSWELEVKQDDGKWMEMLGCGIMRQEILSNSGAGDKVGWAFGLGLERWAMKLYGIPDIRLFWSQDSRFLSQFCVEDPSTPVTFEPFSNHPPCLNDISFWLPLDGSFESEDFYDLARSVGEELIEKIELIDAFTHPKKKLTSHCYRITYRSWEKALTQAEVNKIHKLLENKVQENFAVTLR